MSDHPKLEQHAGVSAGVTELLGVEIRRQSTAEQVAAAIRGAIFSGRLTPGSSLREIQLAEQLGVSRNSVREAVRILEGEHLVHYEMNRGTAVADVSDEEIDDLFAAREVLELAGLEVLQQLPPKTRAEYFEPYLQAIEAADATGDLAGSARADRAFHTALVAASGNEHMRRWYEGVRQELRLALALAEHRRGDLGRTKTRQSRESNDHRRLAKALQGPDELGRKRLKQHLAYGAAELHQLRKLLSRK